MASKKDAFKEAYRKERDSDARIRVRMLAVPLPLACVPEPVLFGIVHEIRMIR